jgi:hypothetical protein
MRRPLQSIRDQQRGEMTMGSVPANGTHRDSKSPRLIGRPVSPPTSREFRGGHNRQRQRLRDRKRQWNFLSGTT